MRKTCLTHALNKWHEEGGFLLIRKSSHWCVPHVMHLSADCQALSNFVPPSELPAPWYSLFGFEGVVLDYDSDPAERISIAGVLLGVVILLLSVSMWAAKTKLEELSWRFWLPPNN